MDNLALAFKAAVVGRSCRVQRREADWAFDLRENVGLAVGCHWRLISADGIQLSDEDDGQGFGLPDPVDAETKANDLLAGATVFSATVDPVTADLCLRFSNGLRLDLLNNSSGYEGWHGHFNHDGNAVSIIAMGGRRPRLLLSVGWVESSPHPAPYRQPQKYSAPAGHWEARRRAVMLAGI